jgi:dTDP-4-amino-4,6-dideoxygalactose transaminase
MTKSSICRRPMGLTLQLFIEEILTSGKKAAYPCNSLLDFTRIQKIQLRPDTTRNYSYYPVLFESEAELLKAEQRLIHHIILARRYFYTSLNTLSYLKTSEMPVYKSVASKILCLPLFNRLNLGDATEIVKYL